MKAFLDRKDDNSIDKLTEKEATTILSQMESTEDELYQLKKKFIANLKGVLPATKILKLKKQKKNSVKNYCNNIEIKKLDAKFYHKKSAFQMRSAFFVTLIRAKNDSHNFIFTSCNCCCIIYKTKSI